LALSFSGQKSCERDIQALKKLIDLFALLANKGKSKKSQTKVKLVWLFSDYA